MGRKMTGRKLRKLKKEDWVDPFIRSLVGWKARPGDRLLVKILESGKGGIPVSELTPAEVKRLSKHKKMGDVEITANRRVRLTKLGATIARGAKKLYPEFWG